MPDPIAPSAEVKTALDRARALDRVRNTVHWDGESEPIVDVR